jgi:hypothetical protein
VAWEHGSVEDAQLGWGGSWLRLLSMWDRATWGHVGACGARCTTHAWLGRSGGPLGSSDGSLVHHPR